MTQEEWNVLKTNIKEVYTMNVIENLNKGGSVGQIQPNSLIHADCLDAMKYIESKSIDTILCDLPYG
jgi:DNA modification methylase